MKSPLFTLIFQCWRYFNFPIVTDNLSATLPDSSQVHFHTQTPMLTHFHTRIHTHKPTFLDKFHTLLFWFSFATLPTLLSGLKWIFSIITIDYRYLSAPASLLVLAIIILLYYMILTFISKTIPSST